MSSVASIADATSRLPAAERARVALMIMDSLPPEAWEDDAILAEAEHRDAEIESGRVKELSHAEFVAGLRH